jgi:hypothetical protein
MRLLLSLLALLIAFAGGLGLAARGGEAARARAPIDTRVDLVVRSPSDGRLSHGYVHIIDTDTWIPILGTPDDGNVQEPLEQALVTRIPYGVRFDVIAYGHDTGRDRPGTWESREHYVWGPQAQGRYTITLGSR